MSFLNKKQQKPQNTPPSPTPVNVVNEVEIADTEREPLHAIVDKVHEHPNTHSQVRPFCLVFNAFGKQRINLEQQNALEKVFSSAAAKNEATITIWVRLHSSFFAGSYVEVPLESGEHLKWVDLFVESIENLQDQNNIGATVNVVASGYSYWNERSTPDLEVY